MNTISLHPAGARALALAVAMALALAGCGGGGGNPGAVGGAGSTGSTGGTGGTTTPPGSTAEPAVKLAITDAAGGAITMLSGGQSGTIKATVTTATGTPAAGAIVKFTASDTTLVEFTPASGSALTDASGVAVITVKPASVTAAGALSIVATSVVDSKTATASANIAVGAAPLTIGALSFTPAPTAPLPAFSTLSLNVPVTSGGQPVATVSGLSLTSLCQGDGMATLVPGAVTNGVQLVTYTNNGCLRGRDVITASVGTSVRSIPVDVSAANIGSVQFVGSNVAGSSIVLKGSGGLGRAEAAQLTFKVVDQHNNGLAGVDVKFSATTTTGGLAVTPAIATTDAAGNVTTMVSSGTIPTPVRVTAEATRNGVTISGLSDTLTISTGLPIQRSMSMSADVYNIEGGNYDGEASKITVRMADQYGNPVSDGTAINFVTEGGAVGSSAQGACTTVNGGCTVSLISQEFRPADGRVTVLAFAQGIPDFKDDNGDGQYTCTDYVAQDGSKPATYRPLVDKCLSGGETLVDPDPKGDAFLDTNMDKVYTPSDRDKAFPYNSSTYSSAGLSAFGITYIRRSIEIVFSGSTPKMQWQACGAGGCTTWAAADPRTPAVVPGLAGTGCSNQTLNFRLTDEHNNALPAGTSITAVDVDKVTLLSFAPDKVASTPSIGGTLHSVLIKPEANCSPGVFSVKVETPKKQGLQFPFKTN
jgi:hypothetical protein